jgi:tetratricopeptide (TPR) repeat protein
MTTAAQPSNRLHQRISRWEQGDPDGVLADEALVEAARLWWVQVADAGDDLVDLALHLLAWLHWARFENGPQDEQQIEKQWALEFFRVLWQRRPTASPTEIQEYFRGAKPPTIEDIKAHTSGILRGIAAHALTRHRDTGIRLFALSEWPPDLTADAAPVLLQVAMALTDRHAETGDAADLDAAVTYGERALDLATEPDLLRAKLLQNVAVLYGGRFETTSAMSDIDRGLALTDEALTITRSLSADPAQLLANRSAAQWQRFVAFQHLDDLREAVADGTAAVDALPPGSPSRAAVRAQIARLSQLLLLHPDKPEAGAADHVTPLRAALAGATGDAQETLRTDLGLALAARYEQSRRIEDLQEAIGLFRDNTPGRSTSLLATVLRIRFDVLGDTADLDECISLYRRAGNSETWTAGRISVAENLAEALEAEYQVRPDPARLHAAIDVGRTAVLAAWPDPTAPEPDPGLLPTLESLAQENLRRRLRAADRTGDHDFVLSSEAMTDAAYLWWLAQRLTARDPASPSLTRARGVLGDFHILRHNATVDSGRPDELAQTLMHWLPPEARPDDLPEPLDRILGPRAEPEWQTRYANTLISHASRNRNPAAVNAAVLLLSAAIEATPADDPQLPERLGGLSDAYLIRGVNVQDTGDLDVAARLAAEAVALAPPDAPRQRERLVRARSLRLRFARRRATPDPGRTSIDRVGIVKEYVDGPEGAEIAAMMDAAAQEFLLIAHAKEPATDKHSSRFLREFRRGGLAVDLELALRAAEAEAETIRQEHHIERLGHLSRLSDIRLERYLLTRENAELAEAARLLEEALDLAPQIGPYRGPLLRRLTQVYDQHSELTGAQMERLCHLARTTITDAMDSLTALRGAGRLALRHKRYDLAVTCYREAVALMRVAALEEIDRVDRAARLTEITEVGSEAVTAHILAGDPATALEAAEEARAVLLSLELDLRSDLTKLREARPDLAERFDRLRKAVTTDRTESARTPDGYVRTVQASQSRDAWANLLDDIRAVPGHENFLRPLAAAQLTALNLPGPIVLINVSRFGSHALIVGPEPGVRALPLDGLDHEDVRSHAYDLLSATAAGVTSEILAWLWTAVVGPVLENARPSRVWWVPTGLLSAFPLHAATAPQGRSALDLVESSYAPTIRLLSRNMARATAPQPGSDLIVAVRRTANGAELAGAEAEGHALTERHPDAVVLLNDAATRESVLAALPQATRAYFACHNLRDDAHPHLSGLALFDGLLTIDDLSHLDLPNAEFAQLSACATVMPTPDAPDELTHLAAAFQLAGFRNVIATLWPVRDQFATEFSQLFHDAGGHTTASAALAGATRALRDRHPNHPDLWAPFLHYGL